MTLSSTIKRVAVLLTCSLCGCSSCWEPAVDRSVQYLGLKKTMPSEVMQGVVEEHQHAEKILYVLRDRTGYLGRFEDADIPWKSFVGKRIQVQAIRTLSYIDQSTKAKFDHDIRSGKTISRDELWKVLQCTAVGVPQVIPSE